MKVLFCGGGTAGHVMPAIAMAQIIEKNFESVKIAFVGRVGGNENRSIIKSGYTLHTIDIKGLQRKISIDNIKTIFKVIKSSRVAKKLLTDFKPDIVIGTGGYVCYPVIRKAQQMKIPTMLHESNVYPGVVTRVLGKRCSRLLLNHEGTKKYLSKTGNTSVVGNPLRTDFKALTREEARKKLNLSKNDVFIVSFGGSLGSPVMNDVIIKLIHAYSTKTRCIKHIHATGVNNYPALKKEHPTLCIGTEGCLITPYIDNMPTYLQAADIVISRSGAITISELAAAKAASILIPSPNVAENHQYVNAKYVADKGAALLIEEKDLTVENLISAIEKLVSNTAYRKKLGAGISEFLSKNVEESIVREIRDIL